MLSNQEKILFINNKINQINELLDNCYQNCTGFYVDHQKFIQLNKELNHFFHQNFESNHPIISEFREIVTDNKKHKLIHARVILKELAESVQNSETAG